MPRLTKWHPDLKQRPSGLRIESYVAVVLPHDAIDAIQSKARAFADAFGGKERLEYAVLDLRRDAGAIVFDVHEDRIELPARADAQLTLSVHSVDRVVDE